MAVIELSRLTAQLSPSLTVRWVVLCGDELLLQQEAADQVREYAKSLGHHERHRFELDGRSDWSDVWAVTNEVSLFGDKHVIDLYLPSGKPGRQGSDALLQLCEAMQSQQLPDSFLILHLPWLDRATRQSKWAKQLSQQLLWVDIRPVERSALPQWIRQRLAQQHQSAPQDALFWLGEQVEGNLVAAHQEVSKLGLLYPEGELSLEQIQAAVLNVARYNVFDLRDAMLAGQAQRALTILHGLQGEGAALPLVLWAIGEELRLMARFAQHQNHPAELAQQFKQHRIFGSREQAIRQCLQRLPTTIWPQVVRHAHDIDCLIKGLKPSGRLMDPWDEAARLCLRIALRA